MRNIIRFVLFLIYTVAIFFIKDIKILGIIFALNCIVAVLVRVNIKKFFGDLKIILPFLILTFIFNMFFDGWICGILITIRIIICYQITCIFSLIMTVIEISDVVERLCLPLKLFKINTKNIGVIISIAICMIPILREEIDTITRAMRSRGKNISIRNSIIVMRPILISVLKRTNEMEKTLIVKGYEG